MSYLVIARKYRPQNFKEVIGQEHIAQTLKNAIRLDKLSHAYLFTGPRGVGKTTTARILAKAINCPSIKDEEPCNNCPSCNDITSAASVDVIEIDAASNRGVDEIRQLRENVKFAPASGKYKVYIIDEVHMLTKEAFNALLKTLEEPPAHIVFIMATTEPEKVLQTITSRCQTFSFKLISENEIQHTLRLIAESEKASYDDAGLLLLAKASRGSMRDAESLLDQSLSYAGGEVTSEKVSEILGLIPREFLFKYTDAFSSSDIRGALEITESLLSEGYNVNRIFNELLMHFRNLMYASAFGRDTDFMGFSSEYSELLSDASKKFSSEQLVWMTDFLTANSQRMKYADDPRIVLDTILFKLSQKYVGFEDIKGKMADTSETTPTNVKKLSPPVEKPVDKARSAEDKTESVKPSKKPLAEVEKPTERVIKPSKKGRWNKILDLIQKESPPLYHILKEAKVSLVEKTIKITIGTGLNINDKKLSIMKKCINEVMGEGYRFDILRVATPEKEAVLPDLPEPGIKRATPAEIESREPIVKKISETFKGRIEKI